MEEPIQEPTNSPTLSDSDIFLNIWLHPRKVLNFINENQYHKYVTFLLILAGISRSFDRAIIKNMGDKYSLFAIITLCIIVGILFGWLAFYIFAALVSWTGKWINAKGNTKSILNILAYSMIPNSIALLFVFLNIGIFGIEIFKENGNKVSTSIITNSIYYFSNFMELVLALWSIIICVIGISEVQKLTIGKAILNLLLPAVILLIPFAITIFISFLFN